MSQATRVSFWNAINKPIVIWFLATVVVGLVTFGWDQVQNEREIRKLERKLDLEIASRLMHARIFYFPEAYAVGHVRALGDHDAAGDRDVLDLAYRGFRMFRQALDAGTAYGTFPEFQNRNLQSLIWELSTLRDDDPQGPLRDALLAAISINRQQVFWMNRQNFEPGGNPVTGQGAKQAILAELEEFEQSYAKLRLERWRYGIGDETLRRYTPQLNLPELGD